MLEKLFPTENHSVGSLLIKIISSSCQISRVMSNFAMSNYNISIFFGNLLRFSMTTNMLRILRFCDFIKGKLC